MKSTELQKAPGTHLPPRPNTVNATCHNMDRFGPSDGGKCKAAPHRLTPQNARGIGVA